MLNWIITPLACCGLALGVVALLSPIPVGLVIIGASTATLVCVSPRARRIIQRLRRRFHWLNQQFHRMEARLEQKYLKLWRAFTETRPHSADSSTTPPSRKK